jgi:uncharacterized cofD-like protein
MTARGNVRVSDTKGIHAVPLKVAALGGGHGLAAVLTALRREAIELGAIVSVADDGGSSGELRRQRPGPAVGDVRRSLIASAAGDPALGRALARSVTVNRVGTHPVGNLVLRSIAEAFDDLEAGVAWLADRVGSPARIVPASAEEVVLVGETADGELVHGESTIGSTRIRRLHFVPEAPRVPDAAIRLIADADWVLIAPGSLYTSIFATCAIPAIAAAVARTRAPVVWISNLISDQSETASLSAREHLGAFGLHGVRIDVVMSDSAAELAFDPTTLLAANVRGTHATLVGPRRGEHDPRLLREALRDLFASSLQATAGGAA